MFGKKIIMRLKVYGSKCVIFQLRLKLSSNGNSPLRERGKNFSAEKVGVHGVVDRCTCELPFISKKVGLCCAPKV